MALLGETGGPGGAERMMLQLAAELRVRGHDVVPIGPEHRNPWLRTRFRELGFDPQTFNVRGPLDPIGLAQIAGLIRRLNVDVVHTHEFLTSAYGGAAAWLQRVPFVITMHGSRYYAERFYRRAVLRWSAGRSSALVAVSDATADDLRTTLRLPTSAVLVIRNGVRQEPGDAAKLRRELGIRPGELLIVAIGNLYAVKGHVVLLRALRRLGRESLPPWQLAIAGRGKEETTLRGFAAAHGMEKRVSLLGFREDVADVVAAADVFAMPSLSEGLPLALVEAMLAGKAIVASRTGGIPEVVTHGADALLAPPGDEEALADQLRALLQDAELRARCGDAARRRAAASLTVERMTDEYERLYALAQRT